MGRRASGLARGRVKVMVSAVQGASSATHNERLLKVTPSQHDVSLGTLVKIKDTWCEEKTAKCSYWHEQLPWMFAGLCPKDPQSQPMAIKILDTFHKYQRSGFSGIGHQRITYTLMHPDTDNTMYPFVVMMARTGIMDPLLEIRAQEFNLSLTVHEQRVEELHARLHWQGMHPGRAQEPPGASAKLRWPDNIALLQRWEAKLFLKSIWTAFLGRELLKFSSCSEEFVRHAECNLINLAVRPDLPQQHFSDLRGEYRLQHGWSLWSGGSNPQLSMQQGTLLAFFAIKAERGNLFNASSFC